MPLTPIAAERLATTHKTAPLWGANTPRWLLRLLPWVQVKAGVFRINRVTTPAVPLAEHSAGTAVVASFPDYEVHPREITLSTVQSVLKIHTRIPDLFNYPHDQLREQMRLTVEAVKEEKERRLINSADFGLLANAAPSMRIQAEKGTPPTPDAMDELLSLVWKMPAFFVAHPRAIAAFGRACSARGVSMDSTEMFGATFHAWRGVPILPSDKMPIARAKDKSETSSIMLMRTGEEEQGVVGLHQEGVGDERLQSLAVRSMGIDDAGVQSYLVTCYFSVAVLVEDALAVLENVRI